MQAQTAIFVKNGIFMHFTMHIAYILCNSTENTEFLYIKYIFEQELSYYF